MQLSSFAKEQFFHGFAQLLRSGIPVPRALESLGKGRGRSAVAARTASGSYRDGLSGALATAGFEELDCDLVAAGEQTGRLEEALERLAEYHGSVAAARKRMVAQSIYPFFIIHLAALLLSIPRAILGDGLTSYLASVAGILGPVYLLIGVAFLAGLALRIAVRRSPSGARTIRAIPVLGGFFTTLAMTRFCLVLSLGIRSADGILSSLRRAGRSSSDASVEIAAERGAKAIRSGSGFAEALAVSGVFPADLEQAFHVAETSGRLDSEMSRWAGIFRERLFAQMETLSTWIPRLLYLAICLAVAYQILAMVQTVGQEVSEVLEF